MAASAAKKSKKLPEDKIVGGLSMKAVLKHLAAEDYTSVPYAIENYYYEKYQPTSVLPTDTDSRTPIQYRVDPFDGVHVNARDIHLENKYTAHQRFGNNGGFHKTLI
jgi:hypothetical protein